MSYFNSLRLSLESIDTPAYDETLDNEVALAEQGEAVAEAELTRQEIEAEVENVARANNAADEIDAQNEAVQTIIEKDGTLDENTAAFVEASRRAVASGMGLDPDEGVGKDLVSAESIAYMVNNPGSVSLEAKGGAIDTVKKYGKVLLGKINELWEAFTKLLGKIFNTLPHQITGLIARLEETNDESFKARLAKIEKEDNRRFNSITVGGKFYRLAGVVKQFSDYSKLAEDYAKKLEKSGKGVKAKELIETASNSNGQTFQIADKKYSVTVSGLNYSFVRDEVEGKVDDLLKVTRGDLIATLKDMSTVLPTIKKAPDLTGGLFNKLRGFVDSKVVLDEDHKELSGKRALILSGYNLTRLLNAVSQDSIAYMHKVVKFGNFVLKQKAEADK